MAYIASKDKTLAFALESAFGTPNGTDGDFVAVSCTPPKITRETEIESPDILTGQAGADSPLVIGARKAKLEFSMYLDGLGGSTAYVPGTDQIGDAALDKASRWFALVAAALGGKAAPDTSARLWRVVDGYATRTATNRANKVDAGCTTSATKAKADTDWDGDQYTGSMVLSATAGSTTTIAQGWSKTRKAGTPTVVDMFEAMARAGTDLDELYATATAWMSGVTRATLTARVMSGATCEQFTSCVCEKLVFHFPAGKRPWVDFTMRAYDYQHLYDATLADYALIVPRRNADLGQMHAGMYARLTLGGTATCGIGDLEVSWEPEIVEIPCIGSGISGVSDAYVSRNHVRAKFSIPRNSTDAIYNPTTDATPASGNVKWQRYLERGTTVSIGVYGAAELGRCFGLLCPSMILDKVPEIEERDSLDYWQIEAKGSTYDGDGKESVAGDAVVTTGDVAADTPMNSLLRVAVG